MGRQASELLNEASKGIWLGEMAKRKVNEYEPYEVAWQNRDGELIHTIVSPPARSSTPRGYYAPEVSRYSPTSPSRKKSEEDATTHQKKNSPRASASSPDANDHHRAQRRKIHRGKRQFP